MARSPGWVAPDLQVEQEDLDALDTRSPPMRRKSGRRGSLPAVMSHSVPWEHRRRSSPDVWMSARAASCSPHLEAGDRPVAGSQAPLVGRGTAGGVRGPVSPIMSPAIRRKRAQWLGTSADGDIDLDLETLRDYIKDDLTPLQNAENMLKHIVESGRLADIDEAVCRFVSNVLKHRGEASIPGWLRQSSDGGGAHKKHSLPGEVGEEVSEWLRTEFSPLPNKDATKGSFKGKVQGILFALRLKRTCVPPPPPLSENCAPSDFIPFEISAERAAVIHDVMDKVDDWDFDVFELRDASGGREVEVMGWTVFRRWGALDEFSVDEDVLKNFLKFVADGYSQNPYHNGTHAADILQTTNFMLKTAGVSQFLSTSECISILLSALVHDLGHDGLSNNFHKNSMSERALRFNDQSIQENYHAAHLLTSLCADKSINIFQNMPKKKLALHRSMLIEMLLLTDMSKHFSTVDDFRGVLETNGRDPEAWSNDTLKLIGYVLHACDISAQSKQEKCALKWCHMCHEEFFNQGDKEKELSLPVSPCCDRESTDINLSQVGFIRIIVLPTFQMLGQLLPVVNEHCVPCAEANLEYYQKLVQEQEEREGLDEK
eukprot:CAMPEP_0206254042 /NCGR_PEP_ID=MMETSP0047_2-20121206/23484_1 /ASSEMBLY_ACC=CAM_ASM_000192 /TAXON_ID=195065 /ORGANISM="Chroomonas mesostigmatica_cf, Strain CCMP1168" /LENGTH=599 /DNA_ID=CAMNT_0053680311 /DNA_START=95 /DNA_END=1891 /DNA_ORIENTATION=-